MPLVRPPVVTLVLAAAISALSTLAGCAATGGPAAPADPIGGVADDFVRSRLVAADFVDVIAQLPALAPARTVLATPAPDSRFGELLFGALQDEGYDMRIGAGGGGALDWTITRSDDGGAAGARDGEGTYTFLVSAAGVKLKRDYAVDAAGIRPVSTMLVHGADASAVVIDHSRFARGGRAPLAVAARDEVAGGVPGERSNAALSGAAGTVGALRAAPAPSAPVPATRATRPAPAVVTRAVPVTPRRANSPAAPRANLYETRRSAFAATLAGYATVDKRVMVFGNDSLVMGADNKRLARELAARFDPETDVVSLIGCSHGRTALADGNETLAVGRAARVKEELMIAGVDPALVLDEGCWAGEHFDRMPARGVVVTHKRRAGR